MITYNPEVYAPADSDHEQGFALVHIPTGDILDFEPPFWDMPDRVAEVLLKYMIGVHWSQIIA